MEISALRRLHSRADAKTLNLGLGQPEVDMPEDLREIALEAIGRSGLGYTANAGRSDLRELVARHYELETEEVLISHGAQEGLMATLIALVSPGDEILVPDPGFLAYPKMISLAGGKAVPYSLRAKKGFCYDPELILSKVTPRTRAVILCSPNNPCGTMISAKDQKELLAELEKRGIFLLCDDVYAELAFRDPYKPASKESQYAVVINSWSKSLALPGWRIG